MCLNNVFHYSKGIDPQRSTSMCFGQLSEILPEALLHYETASGHREKKLNFFKSFQFLPPDCLPESPKSTDSESVIQIQIEAVLVGVLLR